MPEKPSKNVTILLVIIIVLLVGSHISLNSRITNLEMALNSQQFQQMHEIRALSGTFMHGIDSINEQVAQQARLSFSESATIVGYQVQTLSADVEISFNLKEFNDDDIVTVNARGIHSGEVFSAEASLLGAGRFSTSMTLPLQDNYVISFAASGLTTRVGELLTLSIANELCDRFEFGTWNSHGFITGSSNQAYFAPIPHFMNNTRGDDYLGVREIYMIVESDDMMVKTWDLLPHLQRVRGVEVLEVEDPWDFFEMPITRDRERFENADISQGIGYIIYDAVTVARLVMYDNLGIRYEQVDELFIFGVNHVDSGFRSSAQSAGGGWTMSMAPARAASRVIEAGEYAWGRVYIVRQ